MIGVLRGIRSLFSVVLVGLLFLPGSLVLRLVVIPLAWLRPARRHRLASVYLREMSRAILAVLTIGGARFRRFGELPTAEPALIIANHQALIDILQVALLARPDAPSFVSRKRYARFVPLVSATIRLLRCPLVDPRRDPAGSVEAVRRGARELTHGILIFPEGHRSRTGAILPFRTAGVENVLRERRMPVYLVLNDGCWKAPRFVDLLFRVHRIDAVCEVVGRFDPPDDPDELASFLHGLRARLVARLEARRPTSQIP